MRQDTEERAVLEQIASNLEAEGFKVIVQPSLHIVPAFLRDYEPDAIAIGRDQNLVIEIARSSERTASRLEKLRNLIAPHKDWQFKLYSLNPGGASRNLDPMSRQEIAAGIANVDEQISVSKYAPALLMAWATFEALCRSLLPKHFAKPQTPGRIIEVLAYNGYLSPDEADQLRQLADRRNRLIHGVLSTPVSSAELVFFLGVLTKLLAKLPT